jgi:hypothetical protein
MIAFDHPFPVPEEGTMRTPKDPGPIGCNVWSAIYCIIVLLIGFLVFMTIPLPR